MSKTKNLQLLISTCAVAASIFLVGCEKSAVTEKPSSNIATQTELPKIAVAEHSLIQPFGDFKWGDDFSTVLSKICAVDSIESIKVRHESYSKDAICLGKHFDFNYFYEQEAKKLHGLMLEALPGEISGGYDKKGFDGNMIGQYPRVELSAQPITIHGVGYKIDFRLNDSGHNQGAYLVLKNKAITLATSDGGVTGTVKIPAALEQIILDPIDKDKARVAMKETYNTLYAKYQSYPGLSADESNIVLKYKGTSLSFGGSGDYQIIYDGTTLLKTQYSEVWDAYQKAELAKNTKKDLSNSL